MLEQQSTCPLFEKRDEKNAMLKLGETRCYEQIHQMQSQQKSDPFDYFKLSYEPNEKIPFVIDGVEVQTVEQYGKKIIATRPLKVGDIISIESAFCPILLTNPELYPSEASNKFNHCRHCLNDNFLDLIPCADCNSAMFCNVNCMMQAHGYHQHDCSIASAFESLREDQVIIRSFFRAVSIVDGSIEELEELFNKCLALPNRTIFDFDFSNSNDPEYGKNQLRVALSLSHEQNLKKIHFDNSIYKMQLMLRGFWTPKHAEFVRKFLLHLEQLQFSSTAPVGRRSLMVDKPEVIGAGKYLFAGLINHSCSRNVVELTVEDKMCLVVVKPIEPGEQIFESYTPWFHEMSIEERKKFLWYRLIKCDCEACKDPKRYSLGKDLPVYDETLYDDALKMVDNDYSEMTRDDIIDTANKLKRQCQNMYTAEKFPCKEYLVMFGAFLDALRALASRHLRSTR